MKEKKIIRGIPLGFRYDIHINDEIGPPDKYLNELHIIRDATPNDIVNIFINSYGGRINTAIQFMNAMANSSAATIRCIVEGACHSAATMIFLYGDAYHIAEHSSFCFHNYSGGCIGKGNEIASKADHDKEWSNKLAHSVYNEFLTKKEIDDMLNGKDIWLTPIEVNDRLIKRQKVAEKARKKAERDANKST